MSKVLFISQPQVGHLNTLLSIALQMKDDGHQTRFLVPGTKTPPIDLEVFKTASLVFTLIEKEGISANALPPPILAPILAALLPFFSGYREFMLALEVSSIGLSKYVRSIIEHIEQDRPDIIVTDFTFYAAHIAADLAQIPYATIYHTGLPFKGRLIPPFASGLPIGEDAIIQGSSFSAYEQFLMKRLDRRINRVRNNFGLSANAPEFFRRPYSQWLNLVVSAEVLEAPRDNLTDTTYFIGPCFGRRKGQINNFPFHQLRSDKYKIYVSLGTVFNNKPHVFRKIINALNHPDYQVIISAGGAFNRLKQDAIPDNVMLFSSVPQIDLLPEIDLVIGHGGNNTTNETLAAGKPLIVMPIGGEQGDNASRVEYLGAGCRININNFSEQELVNKVEAIRTNEQYKRTTLAIKQALEKMDASKVASKLIQWVIEKREPLIRPKDAPLTVSIDNLYQYDCAINKIA